MIRCAFYGQVPDVFSSVLVEINDSYRKKLNKLWVNMGIPLSKHLQAMDTDIKLTMGMWSREMHVSHGVMLDTCFQVLATQRHHELSPPGKKNRCLIQRDHCECMHSLTRLAMTALSSFQRQFNEMMKRKLRSQKEEMALKGTTSRRCTTVILHRAKKIIKLIENDLKLIRRQNYTICY